MPATEALTVNGTRRPSTNESDAASSQTAAGAPNGRLGVQAAAARCRRSPGWQPEVVVGAIASSCLMATSEALSERHEHDQRVESVLSRERLSRLTR